MKCTKAAKGCASNDEIILPDLWEGQELAVFSDSAFSGSKPVAPVLLGLTTSDDKWLETWKREGLLGVCFRYLSASGARSHE